MSKDKITVTQLHIALELAELKVPGEGHTRNFTRSKHFLSLFLFLKTKSDPKISPSPSSSFSLSNFSSSKYIVNTKIFLVLKVIDSIVNRIARLDETPWSQMRMQTEIFSQTEWDCRLPVPMISPPLPHSFIPPFSNLLFCASIFSHLPSSCFQIVLHFFFLESSPYKWKCMCKKTLRNVSHEQLQNKIISKKKNLSVQGI